MYKKLSLFATALFLAASVNGQELYNVWLRGTVHIPLSSLWLADAEVQHRRQSSMPGRFNPDKDLLYSLRPWLRYRSRSRWLFSFSPLAWFRSYTLSGNENLVARDEYRTAAMAMLQYPLSLRINLMARGGLEYRMFVSADDLWRSRYFVGCKTRFSKHFGLLLYDELFLGLNDIKNRLYDQNRIALSVTYDVINMLDVELGYMHIHRRSPAPSEGNIFMMIGYKIPQHKPMPEPLRH